MEQSQCRLCLINDKNTIDIYSGKDELNIKNILFKLFQIEVNENDDYTRKICIKCFDKIQDVWQYFNFIKNNQNNLISIIREDTENILTDYKHDNPEIEHTFENLIDTEELNVLNTEENINDVDFLKLTEEQLENHPEQNEIFENNKTNESKKSTILFKSRKKYELKTIPSWINTRMTKKQGDEKIREFANLNCNICTDKSLNFNSFKDVQEHYENEHKCKGYIICCSKRIYRKDRLIDHIINHIHPDAFKCPECMKVCKSRLLLVSHLKQHLPVNERKFQCTKCGQKFVAKSQLKNHETSHLKQQEKKYKCDECGKAFGLKFVLANHKLIHSKECNFVCEICAKSFSTKANLHVHIKNHHNSENTPKEQCNICNLWYKNSETLRTHKRRHFDNNHGKYICNTCNKECSTKNSLTNHIRYVHLNIHDYNCTICKRKFRRKLEMIEHVARHTGQLLYSCQFCNKDFSSSSNYFSHRKRKHPKEFEKILNKI